jgi:hypothetical protein
LAYSDGGDGGTRLIPAGINLPNPKVTELLMGAHSDSH